MRNTAFTEMDEKESEIELLKVALRKNSETSAAIERDLRLRLCQAEKKISELKDRLRSEAAINQIHSNYEAAESERLYRKRDRKTCGDTYCLLSEPLCYSGDTSSAEHASMHGDESDVEDRDRNRAISKISEAARDVRGSSDSEGEIKDSLLLQNPRNLNASTFIPVAKKRKFNVKLHIEGALVETKEEHWETMFSLLLQFDAEHRHCNVPQRHKFILSNGSAPCLGRWLQFQRVLQRKNRMRADRLSRMQALVDAGKLFWDFNL